ncbi:MAG: hypothetical protein AAGA48_23675 [Myxococcota bacterium]
MKLVLIDRQSSEGPRLGRILTALGHHVQRVDDEDALVQSLTPDAPDVVIAVLPDPYIEEWLPWLDGVESHVYRIAALRMMHGDAVARAWDCGMDDLFAWGASPEEVVGRIEAITRIRRWAYTLGDVLDRQPFSLSMLGSEAELAESVAHELSALAGEMKAQPAGAQALGDEGMAAEVLLSLPDQHLALRFGLFVADSMSRPFGTAVFGEPETHELRIDALKEMANTVGGALKRQSLRHGMTFAMGLPREAKAPPAAVDWSGWLQHDTFSLFAWAKVVGARPRRLAVGALREGMVLVQRVLGINGRLIAGVGTVLTQRTVDKLAKHVCESTLVQVTNS